MLRVPDRWFWEQGYPWFHGLPCLTLRKIPWKFGVNFFIRSMSRMKCPLWEYLEDVVCSWQENWMTGSFLMSWWPCLTLMKTPWKCCPDIAQPLPSQMRCWQGVYYNPSPLSLCSLFLSLCSLSLPLFSPLARKRFIFSSLITWQQQMRCWQGVYYNPF